MIALTEFDYIKLIAAGYGLLCGILTVTIEDGLRCLIKGQKLNWAQLLYKSALIGFWMAIAGATISAFEITSAEIPVENINRSMFPLMLALPLSNAISFLWGEFMPLRKSSKN